MVSVGDGETGSSPLRGKNKSERWQVVDPQSFRSRLGGSWVDGVDLLPTRRCACRSCPNPRGFQSVKAVETLGLARSFTDMGGFQCVTWTVRSSGL